MGLKWILRFGGGRRGGGYKHGMCSLDADIQHI